jgi:orotate phosphoribosyltransferase-like protein
MSFTSGKRVSNASPVKANADMDVLIANAESIITKSAFSGARFTAVTQAFASGVEAAFTWTHTEYDIGTWATIAPNADRITVPAGIAYAQLTVSVMDQDFSLFTDKTTSADEYTDCVCHILKNGSDVDGGGYIFVDRLQAFTISGGIVAVTPGDYFTVKLLQSSGSTFTASGIATVKGWAS